MRINRSFPIEKLMAIDEYIEKTNRRVTFEYIMLSQVNDRPEHAQQLADLLRNKKKLSYVNLIPYNPVSEHDQYSRSSKEAVLKFYDVLKRMASIVLFVKNTEQILMRLADNYAVNK